MRLGSRKGTMKRFVMMVVVILSLLSCISAIRVSSSSSSVMDARSRSHYHYHGGARSPWFDVGAQKRRVPTGSNLSTTGLHHAAYNLEVWGTSYRLADGSVFWSCISTCFVVHITLKLRYD